jgi:hypothetical protein
MLWQASVGQKHMSGEPRRRAEIYLSLACLRER